MGMLREFKEFAMRGNVIDLAVGVVHRRGLRQDRLLAGRRHRDAGDRQAGRRRQLQPSWRWCSTPAQIGADGKEIAAAVLLRYGAFIQSIIDFVLVAFAVFMVIKVINRLQRKREAAPAAGRAGRGHRAADRNPRRPAHAIPRA